MGMYDDHGHSSEGCNTCGGTGEWETTTEDSPDELVSLGECPDCGDADEVRTGPVCRECGRVFDLDDDVDAGEWYYGHDCEV